MRLRNGTSYPSPERPVAPASIEADSASRPAREQFAASRRRRAPESDSSDEPRGQPAASRPRTAAPVAAAPMDPVEAAREEMRHELDFVTLSAALHIGVPSRVQAVTSLIADGTVQPDHFFSDELGEAGHRPSLVDELLDFHHQPRRPDVSMFAEGQALRGRSDAARLLDEIGQYQAVMAACQAPGAHADIRNAVTAGTSAHVAEALSIYPGHAANLQTWQPGEQHRLVRALAPLLDRVAGTRDDEARRIAFQVVRLTGVLDDPQACHVVHPHALGLVERSWLSTDRTRQAIKLARAAGRLPVAHQAEAIHDAARIILSSGSHGFHGDLQPDSALAACAEVLPRLADEALGPAAHRLGELAASRARAPDELIDSVSQAIMEAGSAPDSVTGATRFDRLPDAGKLDLFRVLLQGISDDMPSADAARGFCEAVLPTLPADARERAGELLHAEDPEELAGGDLISADFHRRNDSDASRTSDF